jgi:hypothetical protein
MTQDRMRVSYCTPFGPNKSIYWPGAPRETRRLHSYFARKLLGSFCVLATLIKLRSTSTADSFCGSHLALSSKTDRVLVAGGVLDSE